MTPLKRNIAFLVLVLATIGMCVSKRGYYDFHSNSFSKDRITDDELKNGDIIFQTSLSEQSKTIQIATKSPYSHCGIIFKVKNDLFVFEAVQPVKKTPLKEWISRGKEDHFVVKRLKNSDSIMTSETLSKMNEIGKQFVGKNYDLTFEWSDDEVYCSELVWKIYQRATGLEVGKLQRLKDFNFKDKTVMVKMKERYGDKIPWDEKVISPAAIFNSDLLITIN